MIIIIERKI